MTPLTPEALAVIEGRHADPFAYLGPHVENGSSILRVFLPEALAVSGLWDDGQETLLDRLHDAGLFSGPRPASSSRYPLRARFRDAIVVHGKRSILGRMPGDRWQRFANLRAYYGFMFGHPGKQLLFMGSEFAQEGEWRHEHSLDWHLLARPEHRCVQSLVRDLNALYRSVPALHALDCDGAGFEWLVADDVNNSVFAWVRKGEGAQDQCLVVVNFTPQLHQDYRIRMPSPGSWREVLNTDAADYGGSNAGNRGVLVSAADKGRHTLRLVVPPLSTIFLVRES